MKKSCRSCCDQQKCHTPVCVRIPRQEEPCCVKHQKVEEMTELAFCTSVIHLEALSLATGTEVWGKTEYQNPYGGVKTRIAISMIDAGLAAGTIKPSINTIVEITSDNTGLGLAMKCKEEGIACTIIMPDTNTYATTLMKSLGATVITFSGNNLAVGFAILSAYLAANPNAIWTNQFANPANPDIHQATTGPEITKALGNVDIFIAAVGTGGTFTGVSRWLKSQNPNTYVISVIGQGNDNIPGMTNQATLPIFTPANWDQSLANEIMTITLNQAEAGCKELAQTQDILMGPSTGAAYMAAKQVAARPGNQGKRIVIIMPDNYDKYINTFPNLYL